MRILSKFQDYYDSALAYGFENDRVYLRQNKVLDLRTRPAPVVESELLMALHAMVLEVPTVSRMGSATFRKDRPKDHHLEITPLVFCVGGVVHKAAWVLSVISKRLNGHTRGWREENLLPNLAIHEETRMFQAHPADTVLCNGPVFDVAEYHQALAPWMGAVQEQEGNKQNKQYFMRDLEKIETWLKTTPKNAMDMALSEHMPVAMAVGYSIAESPRLADWKFGRKMDAATLMQELSMFVGNMALNQDAPVALDDKYRVLGHGFDEHSFRKQPTKHGLPKRPKRPHPDTPTPPSEAYDGENLQP